MIITFYSYKGGVGRSMALANVGEWMRQQGLRVVVVDWDLEAPGLESFFAADTTERDALRSKLGLLDLIADYQEIYPGLPRPADPSPSSPERVRQVVEMLNATLAPLAHMLAPIRPPASAAHAGGKLWLLTAGCRSENRFDAYAERVQQFDWNAFYASFDGEAYFEWMRRQLLDPAFADVVLIDSRTGVAEMSGVCTRQLADVVVMMCAPNDQNLEGIEMMARSFTRADLVTARGGRPIELLPVPARVDVSEGRPIDIFEERFRKKLDPYVPEIFRRLSAAYRKLRIPYISAYAYAERLAIGDPDGVRGLQEAYMALGVHLVALSPTGSKLKELCREALQQTFGLPAISITFLDEEGDRLATDLRVQLDRAGVIPVITRERAETVLEAAIAARGTATASGTVVVTVGFSTLQNPRLRALWRRAREHGVCLFLSAPGGPTAISARPVWARRVQLYGADSDLEALVRVLQSPCQIPRVPFMALPILPGFVGRKEEATHVKSFLIGRLLSGGDDGFPRPVALVGLGGAGKTSLARSVCNDEEVVDHFQDGILWLTLGSQADLTRSLLSLLAAFGLDLGTVASLDEAERRLMEQLSGKRCLVVVDEVTESGQLKRIPRGGPECRLLITTRSRDIAVEAGAVLVELGSVASADATMILTRGLPAAPLDAGRVATLTDRLGGLPLALDLANKALRKRVELGDAPTAALDALVRRLDEEGLTAIDAALSGDESNSVFYTLTLAADQLSAMDRTRLPGLAALPPGQDLDIEDIARAGDCSVAEAEPMVRRLAQASLVQFEATSRRARIHPVVHAFLRSLAARQRRVEATRVAASHPGRRKIAISYRRTDTSAFAGRIYDRLSQHLGYDQVFFDVDTIEPGRDFREVIQRQVAEADVLVAVIGPRWLTEEDSKGARRLHDPADFIHLEIAGALAHNVRVIPVLVGGARMPSVDELPPDLVGLAHRNAFEISQARFEYDLDQLVAAIDRLMGPRPPASATTDALASDSAPTLATPTASRSVGRLAALVAAAAVILSIGAGGAYYFLTTRTASTTAPAASKEAQRLFDRAEASLYGRGVTQNYGEAVGLYRRSADMGYAPAENALGRLYENGQGVTKDTATALQWYRRAAKQGHPDARAALNRLGGQLK